MQLHSESLNLYSMFMSVRKTLSETTAAFWADTEIFYQLNQAQNFIARKSLCLKKEVTVTTITSQQEYDLKDNSFADVIDITEDGIDFKIGGSTYSPLKYRTKKQLSNEFPGWRSTSAGTPGYYYYNKSSKTLGLYPKPNSSNAGAYLIVPGYYFPPVLNAGTAAAGATTSITLAAGSSTVPYPSVTNDYYNGLYIEIYSGTGAGQKAEITDYVGSTKVCTLAFTTAPSTDSIYGMVSPLPEEAHYLMPLYTLASLWGKGGSRNLLANNYWKRFYDGLGLFIQEYIIEEAEELVKESYR